MDELIGRGEDIERAAWRDLYEGAPEALRQVLGLEAGDRLGATFLTASRVDHLLLNRVIGFGSEGRPSRRMVASAVGHFEARGIDRYWIHVGSDLRYSTLPEHLREHGVVPYPRSWMKFVRSSAPVAAPDTAIGMREATPADAAAVGELLGQAFDLPGPARALLAAGIGRDDWHYLVIEDRGRVVAAGALFMRGDDGLLAMAATSPDARRRGYQQALMAARLEQAQRHGCRRVFTETGLPVPGEPNSSYRNMLRLGFDELCVRDNFAPEGTKWSSHPSSDASTKSTGSRAPSKTRATAGVPSGS